MSRRMLILLLPLALLLVSSTVAPQPLPIPAAHSITPTGPPSFGLNTHLATRYPDPSSRDVAARTVRELGVPWVREDLHWHRVQRAPDVWDWTFTDNALRELLKRDIEVLGVLGPSVGWATPYRGDDPHDVSFYAPDPDAFVEYARAVVMRYQGYIQHWEIWNEPDNVLFWKPHPDPQAYAELLIRTSAAIKEIDPDAQVLIGGVNPFDTTFLRVVADAGAWDSFDILAIHPYVDPYTPEEGNIVASVDKVRLLSYQYGEKPIWVTEIGWSSGPGDRDSVGFTDETEQAHYLVRSLLLLWTAGVERSFWYMLKDDAHNPYGLIEYGEGRTDMRPELRKPAFAAFQTLNEEIAGTRFVDQRTLFDSSVLVNFDQAVGWRRPAQPNGDLAISNQGVARVQYHFSTTENDYLTFERNYPVLLADDAYGLGIWVYGDGSEHALRVWLLDAEDEVLQYTLGIVGTPGWQFVSTPIGGAVEPGNRLKGQGNGRLDFPASLLALVVDDAHDDFVGESTIYLDDLTAIYGREVYDLRLERDNAALDIIWSPPGMRVALDTNGGNGLLVQMDGTAQNVLSADGEQFLLDVGPEPVFLWHIRD